MTSISQIQQALQALRTEALSQPKRVPDAAKAANGEARKSDPTTSPSAYVTQRIRALDPDDPERHRRAFRIFLEGNLVDLFGADALTHPAFGRLVDLVQDAMRDSGDMAVAMRQVADALLGGTNDSKHVAELATLFTRG